VESGSPPGEAKVLARFTGPGPASPQGALRKEGTLGAAERPPRRGGGQEAALQAERPAQAGREAEVSSKRARKRPERWPLQPALHELATEGV
jgi:hypothetical protein